MPRADRNSARPANAASSSITARRLSKDESTASSRPPASNSGRLGSSSRPLAGTGGNRAPRRPVGPQEQGESARSSSLDDLINERVPALLLDPVVRHVFHDADD